MNCVHTSGPFFSERGRRFTARGVTYGPFRSNRSGEPYPDREICKRDLDLIRGLGANVLRLYEIPPEWFWEMARQLEFRLLVGIPWPQQIRFLDSRRTREQIRERVRNAATSLRAAPNLLGYVVGNEIPPEVVRWYGKGRIERWLAVLADEVRAVDPDALVSYANFPTTEYLELDFADFLCFNVYLHRQKNLRDYILRLQNLANGRPLVLSEFGVDSLGEGEEQQAEIVSQSIQTAEQLGCAGSVVFSFTDEWHTGGRDVEDWAFGLVRADRSPKPVYHAVKRAYHSEDAPRPPRSAPRVSVVVCAYNEERTLEACLESLRRLRYPDYETIVVDDGSTDGTRGIAERFPEFVLVSQENRGLSVARNVGIREARGEIVAFTDADCEVDPDWLTFLVNRLLDDDFAGVGGPNLPPPEDSWVAEVVARSPGGPTHVLLSDVEAEHIPGCNMAFWRHRLTGIGGFDPRFRVAGDDVDVCWRLQDAGCKLGFAPAALVWHRRRHTVGAYLRQQQGYGRAEAKLWWRHPARFNGHGQPRWSGRIYGSGFACRRRHWIYGGPFGSAPFQSLYEASPSSFWHLPATFEWHAVALGLVVLGATTLVAALPIAGTWALGIGLAMVSVPAVRSLRTASRVRCDGLPSWRTRMMVAFLTHMGPLARSLACRAEHAAISAEVGGDPASRPGSTASLDWRNLRLVHSYWSDGGPDKATILGKLLERLCELELPAVADDGWKRDDLHVHRCRWVEARVQVLVQDHGASDRQVDVGIKPRPTRQTSILLLGGIAVSGVSLALADPVTAGAMGAGLITGAAWLLRRALRLTRELRGAVALSFGSLRLAPLRHAYRTEGSARYAETG